VVGARALTRGAPKTPRGRIEGAIARIKAAGSEVTSVKRVV